MLTTGTDNFTGTAANDTFTANVGVFINQDGKADNIDTLQSVDNLVGGAGIDTLSVTAAGGNVALGSLSGIEVMNVRSLGALTVDTAAVAGLTNLNVTGAVGVVQATAAATTDVSVALVENGSGGALANTINGGNNVTVTATNQGATANHDTITVGATTAAAGNVVVNSTGAAYTAATAAATLSAINVTGGKEITVTQRAAADTAAAASDASNATITQGVVTITGNASTTAVTVRQDAAVAAVNATATTGGVTETASVRFSALVANDTVTIAGLTFAATTAMTAAQAAAAFANLVNNAAFAAPASITLGDTQSAGSAARGTYTGVFTGWTSGAAVGDTVVFTSTTANSGLGADLVTAGTLGTVTTIQGKAHDAGLAGGRMGVVAGAVTVNDASGTIKTITIDGVGAANASTNTTTVLETLNLSNVAAGATVTVADTAATLALNVQGLGTSTTDATLTITAAPLTLNVNSIGNNFVNLNAAATKVLNVSGTGVFDADLSANLAALETVRVTESAGLMLKADVASTLKSVDTTGTTGAVTATINGGLATYTGGAGVDTVTLVTAAALTKAIDLGAGDDTLSFGAVLVTGSTAALSGGAGTDTLSMSVTAADALDAKAQTFYTGFERLTLNNSFGVNETITAAETLTLNLENLGFTNFVTTSGTNQLGKVDTLILDRMATNGTVVLTETGAVQVNVADAAGSTTDVLNVQVRSAGALVAGTLTAANVETINVSGVDTDAVAHANSLTLTAAQATTVNVTGAPALTLTLTGSAKVTTIDGTAMTGGLTVQSVNTTSATTIRGGSGADVLTAATGTTADVLIGGAGNDVLVANAGLSVLTGGAGADVFRVATASLNVNSHATITDFAVGDLLQFGSTDITAFASAAVTLAGTAVFQDFANAAINSLATGEAGWFQFGGNTYVVADMGEEGTAFVNGQDFVVMLTGLVNLGNASFNDTHNTIALI